MGRRFNPVALGALVAFALGLGCERQTAPQVAPDEAKVAPPASVALATGVLAIVDGETIDVEKFERLARPRVESTGEPLSAEMKRKVLDQLVDQEILLTAARAEGLDRHPEVERAMVQLLLREEVYPGADEQTVTEEDARRYYDENLEQFAIGPSIQIQWILIRVGEKRSDDEARTELEEIRAKIVTDPDSFPELAQKHSEGLPPKRRGNLGFVTEKGRFGVDPEIVETAFGLEVGELSPVFRTPMGYSLVRVARQREAGTRPFEAAKDRILRRLKQQGLRRLLDEYLAEQRQTLSILVDEEKLAALEVRPSPGGTGDEDESTVPRDGGV